MRLFILRHGERLDRYYSSQWLRQAFDSDGNYCRFSPILPETLPIRTSIFDYDLDPPLTHQGLKDAYQTGLMFKEKHFRVDFCYSSPALRCVQTAMKMLEGLQLNQQIKIRIESGLFECTGWYPNLPNFLTKKQWIENKYPIDKTHHELVELLPFEDEFEYYQRSYTVTKSIVELHENDENPQILFVGHAPSLETCTRQICGGTIRADRLGQVIRNVDYLTMTVIEKNDEKWNFRRDSFYSNEQ